MHNNYFQWDDDFRTGNVSIDDQHFKLVGIINDLIRISYEEAYVFIDRFEDLVVRLEAYVVTHFKSEEELMLKTGVDSRHVTEHKNMHNDFIMNVDVLVEAYKRERNKKSLDDLGEYLIRWLAYHILVMDKVMVKQVYEMEENHLTPTEAYDSTMRNVESSTEPLLRALKALFVLITEKNTALLERNELLEKRVKERTQELVALNVKLKEISLTDELTKLPNRRYAMIQLEILHNNWRRYQSVFSLLYLDADHFKSVNDHYGHEVGDDVLVWISEYLKENSRKSDIVCRLGGDEFVIICEHCDFTAAEGLKAKLLFNLSQLMPVDKKHVWQASLSIGVVEIDDEIQGPSDLLRKADEAMYAVKNSRR